MKIYQWSNYYFYVSGVLIQDPKTFLDFINSIDL